MLSSATGHRDSAARLEVAPRRWRRPVRRALLGLAIAIALLACVLVVRAARLSSLQPSVAATPLDVTLPAADELAERFAGALRFATVSSEAGPVDPTAFTGLHEYLEQRFPRVHLALQREVIGTYSLLYTWTGREPTLPPIVLLAHLDVVPPEAAASKRWTHPPFAGAIADGFVWGRGALDDKIAVMSILEAAEALLGSGFQPRRTILFAFGHDEEVGGRAGAAQLAAVLAQRGVHAELVLDEGMAVTLGIVDGMDAPVALIGVAEKGYLDVSVTAEQIGGHSSMPPSPTAVGRLGRALAAIEASPMPSRLDGAAQQTFRFLAPEMGFGRRIAMANLWLLGSFVERTLSRTPSGNALIRTTIAPTMLSASDRENVLASHARALLNVRLLPGDTADDVLAHLRRVVDDAHVAIQTEGAVVPPSRISSIDDATFGAVAAAIRQTDPTAMVAPGLVVGSTDSKHYARLADHVYRFDPMWLGPKDLTRIHGVDERMSVGDLRRAAEFYVRLVEQLAR